MNPCRPILALLLCAAASLPALAAPQHYAISQAQIAAALIGDGLQVSADQISPLSEVVARVAQPALILRSIQPGADHLLIARMECADTVQCLPFMVALRVEAGVPVPPVQHYSSPTGASPARAPLVQAGSSAILLLEGPHVHISVPVICLENGKLGETVRAANPDRNHFYTVQVAGQGLLRGRL